MILIICKFFFHCNYVISVKRASHRQRRKNIKTLNKTKWIFTDSNKTQNIADFVLWVDITFKLLMWTFVILTINKTAEKSSRIHISAWNSLTLNHQKKIIKSKSCCQLLTAGREIRFSLLTVDLSSNTEEVCDANYFFVKGNKLFLIRRVWIKPGGTAGISVRGAFLPLLIALPFFPSNLFSLFLSSLLFVWHSHLLQLEGRCFWPQLDIILA